MGQVPARRYPDRRPGRNPKPTFPSRVYTAVVIQITDNGLESLQN